MTAPLRQLRARNFQSLADISLDLAPLTVIVGPSNSGKSAIVRALRAVATNSRHANFVRRGAKDAELWLALEETDGTIRAVKLTRGKGTSTYRTWCLGDKEYQEFAKIGTQTPREIADLMPFTEVNGQAVNFTTQFDPPFLLNESSTAVAKTLGELTNINLIFEAVREANRRKINTSQELGVRQKDLNQLLEREQDFSHLPARREAMTRCEFLLTEASAADAEADRIDSLLENLEITSAARQTLKTSAPNLPAEELFERTEQASLLAHQLENICAEIEGLTEKGAALKALAETAATEAEKSDEEYMSILREAGQCPTCGSDTTNLAHA
jgi:predicted ATPase